MARKWSNLNIPGALHFVTGNSLDSPVFKQEACCNCFINNLATLIKDWPCKLIAYVMMPDHFHMIVNPRDGRIKEFTGKLKSLSAQGITQSANGINFKVNSDASSYEVWQESFKAVPLWSSWMIWQKINYIHANPVKAGLVSSAKDYRWSSFNAFYSGSEEPLKVDQEWWWSDDAREVVKGHERVGVENLS